MIDRLQNQHKQISQLSTDINAMRGKHQKEIEDQREAHKEAMNNELSASEAQYQQHLAEIKHNLTENDIEWQSKVNELSRKHQEEMNEIKLRNLKKHLIDESLKSFNENYDELYPNYIKIQNEITSYNNKIIDINDKLQFVYKYHYDNMHSDHSDTLNIVLLGPTGYGKSTFGNRLCGDTSKYGNSKCFKTSTGNKACTKGTEKKIVKGLYPRMLSIVDTAWFHDPDKKYESNVRDIVATLRGTDGINAFLVFCAERFDTKFQTMLRNMTQIFGAEFWDYIIFVRAKVRGLHREEIALWKREFTEIIGREFDFVDVDTLKIFALDTWDDYKAPIRKEFIQMIPTTRFNCDALQSPLQKEAQQGVDQLYKAILQLKQIQQLLVERMDMIYEDIEFTLNEIKQLELVLFTYYNEQTAKKKQQIMQYLEYTELQSMKDESAFRNISKQIDVIDFSNEDFVESILPLIAEDDVLEFWEKVLKACNIKDYEMYTEFGYFHENHPYEMITVDNICSWIYYIDKKCGMCRIDKFQLVVADQKNVHYYTLLMWNWLKPIDLDVISICTSVILVGMALLVYSYRNVAFKIRDSYGTKNTPHKNKRKRHSQKKKKVLK